MPRGKMGKRGTRRKHYKKHGQKVTNNSSPQPALPVTGEDATITLEFDLQRK